jgi:hypothetical protein
MVMKGKATRLLTLAVVSLVVERPVVEFWRPLHQHVSVEERKR